MDAVTKEQFNEVLDALQKLEGDSEHLHDACEMHGNICSRAQAERVLRKYGRRLLNRGLPDSRVVAAEKGLKLWNGRSWEHRASKVMHWYGCAPSGAQMIRYIQHYAGEHAFSRNELKHFSSPCWGNNMDGIEPTPGLWVERPTGKIERVV